jgi:hypothetical protein
MCLSSLAIFRTFLFTLSPSLVFFNIFKSVSDKYEPVELCHKCTVNSHNTGSVPFVPNTTCSVHSFIALLELCLSFFSLFSSPNIPSTYIFSLSTFTC